MRAKNVIDFYVLCNRLKDLVRTGWREWHVERERVESVAEHIYGVQMLAIAIWSEYKYDIDIHKVLFMLAVHEMEEIFIGDITLFDDEASTKEQRGHAAVQKLLSNLNCKDMVKDLVFEFDALNTKEAVFAHQCDKLEADIQCKLYDEQGCVDLGNQQDNEYAKNTHVREVLEKEKSWSRAWLKFGQQRYNYDPNFMEISNYAIQHKILKK